jgi:hypothetical protein
LDNAARITIYMSAATAMRVKRETCKNLVNENENVWLFGNTVRILHTRKPTSLYNFECLRCLNRFYIGISNGRVKYYVYQLNHK